MKPLQSQRWGRESERCCCLGCHPGDSSVAPVRGSPGTEGFFFPGSCVAAASSAQLMETTVLRPLAGPDCPWTSLRHPPLYVLHLLHLGGL